MSVGRPHTRISIQLESAQGVSPPLEQPRDAGTREAGAHGLRFDERTDRRTVPQNNEGATRDDAEEPADPCARLQEPLLRTLAQPFTVAPTVPPPAAVDQVAWQLVRRFAAGGSGRSGAVHLEFGDGELSGGSVQVSSDDGQLSIVLDAPPGVDAPALSERLLRRLRARGLSVASFECT